MYVFQFLPNWLMIPGSRASRDLVSDLPEMEKICLPSLETLGFSKWITDPKEIVKCVDIK